MRFAIVATLVLSAALFGTPPAADAASGNLVTITPLGTGDENIFFTNLNPDRGSSLVGLLNPLGQPVTNLVQFIPLATTRESFDFMLSSFAALQVPWENLHAHARRVRIS